jgi:DNA mismatch repair ATPase MutS
MSQTVACFFVTDHGREMDIAWANGEDIQTTHVVMYDSTTVFVHWIRELQSMIQAGEIHLFGCFPNKWIECIKQLDQNVRIVVQQKDTSGIHNAVHALRSVVNSNEEPGEVPVSQRQMDGCLMADKESLCAMGIMPGIKEGENIFEICKGHCMTVQGKKRLKELLLFPLKTKEARIQRLDQIESLCKNRYCFYDAQRLIKKVGNPLDVLQKMWKTQSLPNPNSHARDFTKLKESLVCLLELAAYLASNFSENASALVLESRDAEEQLHHASCLIDKVVDQEQVQEGMCIHYGVSEELDDLKASFFGTQDLMRHLTVFQRDRLPKVLRHGTYEWEMVHIPQVGVFMHCPEGIVPSYIYDCLPDWELAFEPGALGSSIYQGALYSTEVSNEVHRRIDHVLPRICDLEAAICNKLLSKLLQIENILADVMQNIADIDCLLSLAKLCAEHNFNRPEYSETDDEFAIKNGWNPFIRKKSLNCISNDTEVSVTQRIHVVTGPLDSGKTSYLQQISIISFLAHIGCFVPAQKAIIPQIDRIFIKMGAAESLSDSSFSQSVRRVSDMMAYCSSKSLVVIDEFGKETLSCDGISLTSGIIQYFSQFHAGNPPIVFFATHMGELLLESLSHEATTSCKVLFMETVLHKITPSDKPPSIIYLYKVKARNNDVQEANDGCTEGILPQCVVIRGTSILQLINSGGTLRRNERYSTLNAIRLANDIKNMESHSDALSILDKHSLL